MSEKATAYELVLADIPKSVRKLLAKYLIKHPGGLNLGLLVKDVLETGRTYDRMLEDLSISAKVSTKNSKIKTRFMLCNLTFIVPYSFVKIEGCLGELSFEFSYNLDEKAALQLEKILAAAATSDWCYPREEPLRW